MAGRSHNRAQLSFEIVAGASPSRSTLAIYSIATASKVVAAESLATIRSRRLAAAGSLPPTILLWQHRALCGHRQALKPDTYPVKACAQYHLCGILAAKVFHPIPLSANKDRRHQQVCNHARAVLRF